MKYEVILTTTELEKYIYVVEDASSEENAITRAKRQIRFNRPSVEFKKITCVQL